MSEKQQVRNPDDWQLVHVYCRKENRLIWDNIPTNERAEKFNSWLKELDKKQKETEQKTQTNNYINN